MRAVVHDRYGPPEVLRVELVDQPRPRDNEVLVRVHATSVSRTDCHRRAANPFVWRFFSGLLRPKRRILGAELSGEVEAIGSSVTEFRVGDRVFGAKPLDLGANAEFTCMPEDGLLAQVPQGSSLVEVGAVCDGAIQAMNYLRSAKLRKGQRILIYGASGSIGTAAVQLAHHFDAHVTAVCNTKNIETVRSLGADEVVDYTFEDFTRNGQRYDVVFDAAGKQSFLRCRKSLNRRGLFLATDGWQNLCLAPMTTLGWGRKVRVAVRAQNSKRDVLLLKHLIETGRYRAVIDRHYLLDEAVEATRYVESHQKTGNVVLTVIPERSTARPSGEP
jgi:NADPH:quinone reductase-like Zn-dependent oxidoreductase